MVVLQATSEAEFTAPNLAAPTAIVPTMAPVPVSRQAGIPGVAEEVTEASTTAGAAEAGAQSQGDAEDVREAYADSAEADVTADVQDDRAPGDSPDGHGRRGHGSRARADEPGARAARGCAGRPGTGNLARGSGPRTPSCSRPPDASVTGGGGMVSNHPGTDSRPQTPVLPEVEGWYPTIPEPTRRDAVGGMVRPSPTRVRRTPVLREVR